MNVIPEKFRFNHDYCFFVHDQLADIVVSGERNGIFAREEIKLRDEAHVAAMEGKTGEDLCRWMEENGYKEEMYAVYYKQVIVALLTDMCHFLYEALTCSERGKLTVVYALLRKPLSENLFLFEWLLTDRDDFMASRFCDSSKMPAVGQVTKERKIDVIAGALDGSEIKGWISPEFMYELRYMRSKNYSFAQSWDKAIHLITTYRGIKTETGNFNFVFFGDDERESQWEHIYSTLPLLLLHALHVVSALVSNFAVPSEEAKVTSLRCKAGMILCYQDWMRESELDGVDVDLAEDSMEEGLECPKCDTVIPFDHRNLALFYKWGVMECSRCRRRFGRGVMGTSVGIRLLNRVGWLARCVGQGIKKRS